MHSEELAFEAMHTWRVESWRSPPISCNSYMHLTYNMNNLKCMMKYGSWRDSACVHNINEEIACRKTQQKYQVTIGLKFTTQSTKASEERELQLNKKNAHIDRPSWILTQISPPLSSNDQKGRKVRTNAPEEYHHVWGSPGLGGVRIAKLSSSTGLQDYEDTRLKTSSRVWMGLSLAWKASLAIWICRSPTIVTDSV